MGETVQFAFKMEKGAEKGELIFGEKATDSELFPHGVNWVDVQKYRGLQAYWMMDADEVKIGHKAASETKAMVDSGTTCLAMPQEDFETFKDQMHGDPTEACTGEGMPELTF